MLRRQPRVLSKPKCARSSWKMVSIDRRKVHKWMIVVGETAVAVVKKNSSRRGVRAIADEDPSDQH